MKNVVSTVEKLAAATRPVPALAPVPGLPVPSAEQTAKTYAGVACTNLPPVNAPGQHFNRPGYLQQPMGGRTRSRSPQVKRNHEGEEISGDGFRTQGRQRQQRRPVTSGASQVMVDEVGDLHPSVQYYIGNTPGKADESVIRKVLEKCSVPLLERADGPLVIEKVQLLTREQDPRTKCWRI